MKRIKVELAERGYDIVIGQGILSNSEKLLSEFLADRKCFLITDRNVFDLYADDFIKKLNNNIPYYVFPPGETSKNIATLSKIYNKMAQANLDRNSLVIALGGGVVGDIAGFAAATYMRGIDFIQIPTTLLAMVDSSVGGKTGIDLTSGKNLVGAFWQPQLVLIDPLTLKTLSKREIKSGLAEVIKYGIIKDELLFKLLEGNIEKILNIDINLFCEIIAECCQIKADIVETDEFENGLRAILNYGHTFGHAIESVTDYSKFTHGEAVSVGMLIAAKVSLLLGSLDASIYDRIKEMLSKLNMITEVDGLNPEEIYNAMFKDKKVKAGKINYIIPTDIGKVQMILGIEKNRILSAVGEFCR